ncbi:hypothetical protein I5G60_gp15 [Mycobacterium phage Saguaro]|uniref:Major capsid pentamer protein n=1 Tax=Mycobacterium phage Saguaro TaxID=2315616 RepID=A0A386KCS5_9CAUD|nr:hypothetical protein I5G60_gp15 [Mycobacterium phage Saguaro]AYD82010.1 major capsid pentamer protein [Mycobacterium phage Saguaro]
MTTPLMTPTPVLAPLPFTAPAVNPTAYGLFAAVDWQPAGANRWFNGVEIRPGGNYGGENASGLWGGSWCGEPEPGQLKDGERPDVPEVFEAMTVWAYDECDLTLPSRREVQDNATQLLRLQEQPVVEREFAERLKLDAADLPDQVTMPSLKEAVAYLEAETAVANTVGYFHIGAQWVAREEGLFKKSGTRWTSPLGNVWIIGGGYVDGLDDLIVATSQPVGWRNAPTTRTAIDERHNVFAAVAERSVAIGYEAVIAAVTITAAP